jgi:shikimate kinase
MNSIFLVGFMGAGKTTVGSILAKKMNFSFYDTDQMIVEEESKEIVDIFQADGEEYFRDLESKKLLNIETSSSTVFSTGGGIVLRKENREVLNRNFTIYLKAPYDVIFSRIKEDRSRPLLNTEDPYNTGLKIFESRRELYDSFQFSVETDSISPDLVADKICDLYKKKYEKRT